MAQAYPRAGAWPVYSYARNNPLFWVDPDGNATVRLCAYGVNAIDPSIATAGKTKVTAGADIHCSSDGTLSIDVNLSCWTRLKYGINDPRYGAQPGVSYDMVLDHENAHKRNANTFGSMWAARHTGDEGNYCSYEACLAKARQLTNSFEIEYEAFDAAESQR